MKNKVHISNPFILVALLLVLLKRKQTVLHSKEKASETVALLCPAYCAIPNLLLVCFGPRSL